jgi:diadenosine tetraphosphate (Ap4A) HIT family hydrolase
MRKITMLNGKTVEVEYLSCALTSGKIKPDGGVIVETKYFHAHQDVEYPIEGLVILASKRHIKCFDEFNEEERLDYINLLSKLR